MSTPPSSGHGVVATLQELVGLRLAAQGLELGRPVRARALLAGPYTSASRGRGLEFDEVRAYQPGDDVRSIDWRVTARTGRVHSKIFRDDRERPVWLWLDAGPTLRFGTRAAFKSVAAARAAALLAWSAHRVGDRVGGVITSPESVRSFDARAREHHLFGLLIAMAGATAAVGDTPALPLAGSLERLARKARAGSRVFLLSDFYGLDDDSALQLRELARRCDVTCVLVYDALEAEAPPAGRYRVSDGEGVRSISTQAAQQRRLYAAPFEARREALRELSLRHRMQLVTLRTDDDPVAALSAALESERGRQRGRGGL